VTDWKEEICQELATLKLASAREAEIIEELCQHLDDRYDELILGGTTKEEANRPALVELSEINLLAPQLRRVERAVAPEPITLGGNGASNLVAGLWQDLRYGAANARQEPQLHAGYRRRHDNLQCGERSTAPALNLQRPKQLVWCTFQRVAARQLGA